MAKKTNTSKKTINRTDWISSFNLTGKAKVTEKTFKIDEHAEKSSWIYNNMYLGIDCGDKNGIVYAELMGGYSDEKPGVIYAHGKNDDGSDNYDDQIEVAWEDRFDESILEKIGDRSFITVGLEKTTKNKLFRKKFLSAYDAIAYIKDHLEDGTTVNVRGSLRYSMYQDRVQIRKNIDTIILSEAAEEYHHARFTQSILLDKLSASLKNVDKEKGVMFVDAKVLDYMKEYNGQEVKSQFPFDVQYEFGMNFEKEALCKKIVEKLFKVSKGYTQITFEGEFVSGRASASITYDDLPDDIRGLVDLEIFSLEEAIARCSGNGNRVERMVLTKPFTRNEGDEDNKTTVLLKFENRYTEDDLILPCMSSENAEVEEGEEDDDNPIDMGDAELSIDWLNKLQ